MEKQLITKEQAITDLKYIFNIKDEQDEKSWINAYETDGRFGINKKFMERFPVINKLQDYFKDKVFVDGLGLQVGSITFIYTTFEIIQLR